MSRSGSFWLLITALAFPACGDADPEGATETDAGDASDTDRPQDSDDPTSSTGSTSDDSTSGVTSSAASTSSDTGTSTTATSTTTTDPSSSTGPDSDSSGSTGDEQATQWANVTINYEADGLSETVELDDCTFCDATVDGGVALIRYQQAEGWTVWSIYLPTSFGPGEHDLTDDYSGAYVVISEANPDLPAAVHGFYPATTNVGTVTLQEASFAPGGTVRGTVSAQLGLAGTTATLEAEFSALF